MFDFRIPAGWMALREESRVISGFSHFCLPRGILQLWNSSDFGRQSVSWEPPAAFTDFLAAALMVDGEEYGATEVFCKTRDNEQVPQIVLVCLASQCLWPVRSHRLQIE